MICAWCEAEGGSIDKNQLILSLIESHFLDNNMQVNQPVKQQQVPEPILKTQQGKGKTEATEETSGSVGESMGTVQGKHQQKPTQQTMPLEGGTTMQGMSSKKESLWGMYFDPEDLELRDITCTLKMSDDLNQQQRFLLGNMFVEFADILTPDDVRNKNLPKWPMENPWFASGHVPWQEKRTYRFRALIPILLKYIIQFDEFKNYDKCIGQIDYVGLISDHVDSFKLDKSLVN